MTPTLEPPFANDPRGMATLVEGIPEQIEGALARLSASPWPHVTRIPSTLAVGAMGGSAIAADLTATVYSDRIPRPIAVIRDYRWPAFVTREAFALHCSYSGATEETLALYRESSRRSVPRAALTTGGSLAMACERESVPWHKLPAGMPPRAALFSSWVPITGLLAALEWVDDPTPSWNRAVDDLRDLRKQIGIEVPEADNPAKRLARALHGRFIQIYGSAGRTGAAATRLRQQLNENAKLPGHSAEVPELNHNEIVGWERPDAFHRGVAALILEDPDDGVEVERRLKLTGKFLLEQGADVHVLKTSGSGRLSRLAQHVVWGDYLSIYLAALRGVDPTPVASLDEFKRQMAAKTTGKES
jgi:glucose/mannose-6-phosphate isomerase